MRTPDGEWTVELVRFRGGREVFRVRRRSIAPAAAGWWPTGQIRTSVEEVRQLLGDRFADLEPP
jgi:hypothetical protein